MGQPINVLNTTAVGDVLMIDTDRSITGQEGSGFDSAEAAASADSLPGELAARLFADAPATRHVFVASNQVVVDRSGGWSDDSAAAAATIVANFFVFYSD